jgi:hypothetical protein
MAENRAASSVRADVVLTEDDRKRLARAFGRSMDPENVARLVAEAGAAELLAQATGRQVPSTIADVRAYRIFHLVQAGMRLQDTERCVAALFKVPMVTAKRLVSQAMARFSVELEGRVDQELARHLDEAAWDGMHWLVALPITFVRDRALDIAARSPVPDPQRARRGPIWEFADETYRACRKELGLAERLPPK